MGGHRPTGGRPISADYVMGSGDPEMRRLATLSAL